jgi:hypothetical protein
MTPAALPRNGRRDGPAARLFEQAAERVFPEMCSLPQADQIMEEKDMLKTILLGGVIAIAAPAFAQAPAAHAPVNAATARAPAHDALQTQDDATIQTTSTPATDMVARGDVSGTSPGIRAGLATPTDNCTLGASRSRHARTRCARTGSGAVAATAATSVSAYTGMGGPDTSTATYPACSRTVRDHCTQRGGR